MKKARLLLAVALASLAFTACAGSPTAPGTCVDPGTGTSFWCE